MSQHGSNPVASVGRIVHYRIKQEDLWKVLENSPGSTGLVEGDVVPMMIVRVWIAGGSGEVTFVSGQVFIDSAATIWLERVEEGTEMGQWSWPERT